MLLKKMQLGTIDKDSLLFKLEGVGGKMPQLGLYIDTYSEHLKMWVFQLLLPLLLATEQWSDLFSLFVWLFLL